LTGNERTSSGHFTRFAVFGAAHQYSISENEEDLHDLPKIISIINQQLILAQTLDYPPHTNDLLPPLLVDVRYTRPPSRKVGTQGIKVPVSCAFLFSVIVGFAASVVNELGFSGRCIDKNQLASAVAGVIAIIAPLSYSSAESHMKEDTNIQVRTEVLEEVDTS
jgi:hypothetical protein